MNLLFIYVPLVLIIVAFSLLAIFNFVRYRYKGDLTLLFITLFVLAFIGTIILTFAFIDFGALANI